MRNFAMLVLLLLLLHSLASFPVCFARLFPMSFPFSRSKSHQMRFFHPHLAPPASSPAFPPNPSHIPTPRHSARHHQHRRWHLRRNVTAAPPPSNDCQQTCVEPLTSTPFGSPCGCVFPMKVQLLLTVAPFSIFPVTSELEIEVAAGTYLEQSQVNIMGASADSENQGKTVVDFNLVPLGEKFDNTTATLIYQRFRHKKVPLNESVFGDYEVTHISYPGIPSSSPYGDIVEGVPSASTDGLPVTANVANKSQGIGFRTIAIIVLSGFVLALVLSGAIFIVRKWNKVGKSSTAVGPGLPPSMNKRLGARSISSSSARSSGSDSLMSSMATCALSVKTFTLSELQKATDKFSAKRVLGEGGFGRVYHGSMEDGTEIAVKLLTRDNQNRDREFIAEVEMLSRLHHRNLVKLIGICIEGRTRCLIYELVHNGSVESHLHGEENLVTWARPLLANREGLEQLVDPRLAGTYDFDDMAKVAAIASMCVHQEVSHRPFMGEVVQALKLIYNDADETCGDYCSQKESSVPESAGDLAFSDSSWWNLTPRLRYGQASTFITMDYRSRPLEEMENRPHSVSSIPREGGLYLPNRSVVAAGVRPICLVACGGCSLTVQMWNLHVYGFGQAASQARFQRFHGSSFRLQLIIAVFHPVFVEDPFGFICATIWSPARRCANFEDPPPFCLGSLDNNLFQLEQVNDPFGKGFLMFKVLSFVDFIVSSTVKVGSFVWVEDPEEAWLDGEVIEVNGDDIKVRCTSGKMVVVKVSKAYPKDMEVPPSGVADMTTLAYLHEPGVLQNLKSRYYIDDIYTYTGDILIAVNPFKQVENLYNDHMIALYKGAPFGSLMPHPFAVADAAYRQMINEGVSQSILVSGESGAGKTETAKTLMKYLAKMGGRAVNDLSTRRRSVEDQVLESNPVLEAFGNAKTVRNNNSSRFGKFVEIQFDQRGRISGAAIKTYLLERSRVCQVSDYERNYHCFYMLCAAPPEDTRKLKLEDPTTYRYLNQSRCIKLEGMDDSKEYTKTREAMSIVGISSEEQEAIFRILAAILHLGNIEFTNGEETDSSVPKDKKSLKIAAELFMCDEQALEDSLCKRVMVTPEETLSRCLDPESAALSRDALAKFLYSRLFDWYVIVNKINNSIGQDPDSKNMIGVLDIYGFESFKTNSFEQFCINLTNEKLQFHFNEHVLKMEQDEYKKEEIEWNHIDFPDNRYVLELIEKKPGGIIALLDEACMFPRSTHETFSQKMYETFKKNEYFRKPKLARTDFTVCHYAGDVTYQTEQFLEKNKDYVVAEHQALLGASNCTFIAGLFPLQMEDASKQSKFSSVASQFKQQLALLIERLSTTEPRYIRCVKPNNLLKPSIFENQNVLQQLRCGGMMEAIEVCRAGYPTRKLFDEFLDRFSILASLTLDKSYDEKAACKKLLEAVGLEGYQIGKTKVLLMAGQMAELDARRTEVLGRAARIIQWKFRSYLLIKSAINMQAVCRGHLARHRFEDMRRKEAAALKIQRALQIYLERRTYIEAVVTVQSCLRGMAARNALRKKTKATLVIQIHYRRFLAETHYKKLKKAAVTTQSAWRARLARKELRELKMAAKETGALQAAKSKLEEQVEDLKLTLELEKRMRVDVEESKTQENAKLQLALQEVQDQLKETKVSLLKEVEAAKKTAEMVTVVKEVPIVDTELVEKLKSENENLKSMVTSLEQKIDETEKKFKETTKISEERLKQVLEAESKIVDLKTAMDKLQKMLEDVKNENQVLKQSVSSTPVETASETFPSTLVKNLQNVHHPSEENASLQGNMFTTPARIQEPRGSRFDPRHEDVDALINCVTKSVGFSQGKPVAAFTIYRCLLHWKSFEAERTNLFDRLVQMIGSAIKNEEEEENASLAYWLSNTSTLLFMLQQSLKSGGTGDNTPLRNSPSLVWWMTKGFRSPAAEAIRPVDAKVPALHFKQQLAAYVENIIGIIWDNLKTELNTFLTLCIQAPITFKGNELISDSTAKHWEGITEALNALLTTLKDNFVPPVLIQTIFSQAFSLINVQLFNSLVTRRDNCSFINGEYAKSGLDKLEKWCSETNEEYAGSSWDVLKHTRQAVGFLLIHKKDRISYEDIANDLCPILSIQQHFRLCTLYKDEIYNTESVDQKVIESMEKVMILIDISDFLLKDDSSNSMSMLIDDLSSSMQDKDFSQVKPAEELVENPSFVFLQ
ncbi:unnamed protein product [Brassica oleracea]